MRSILLTAGTELNPCVSTASSRRGAGFCQSRNDFVAEHSASYPSSLYDSDRCTDPYKGNRKNPITSETCIPFLPGNRCLRWLCFYPWNGLRLSNGCQACFWSVWDRQDQQIEALYLTTFCSSASPVFIITYLGHLCLNNRIPVPVLFFILFSGNMAAMVIFRFAVFRNHKIFPSNVTKKAKPDTCYEKKRHPKPTHRESFLMSLLWTDLKQLPAWAVIFFCFLFSQDVSDITDLFRPWSNTYFWELRKSPQASLCLLPLISPGLYAVSCLSQPPALAGLCILAQTRSILHKDLSLIPYLSAKCISGLFSGILMLCYLN